MTGILLLVVSALCLLGHALTAATTFDIEHSLDGGVTYSKRSSFHHNGKGDVTVSSPSGDVISQEEAEGFKALLASNSMYAIRILAQGNNCLSEPVYASIPACELQRSNFKEDLALHVDRTGGLVGMHLTSPVIALPRTCDPRKIDTQKGITLQTKVRIVEPTTAGVIPVQATGPRPPALANLKIDVEDVGEAEKPEASQSFLRKYWYIVLPMVLFTLFGGVEPPPEGGAGAGAAAGGSAGAPAAAASK
mmetsp:Transcript_18219/g.30395  ORF Transcript_18219/g.30395 Transcript_18219/m.30395 type:complete len:249 (-) Transcript_18219:178-924(-)